MLICCWKCELYFTCLQNSWGHQIVIGLSELAVNRLSYARPGKHNSAISYTILQNPTLHTPKLPLGLILVGSRQVRLTQQLFELIMSYKYFKISCTTAIIDVVILISSLYLHKNNAAKYFYKQILLNRR